MIYLDYQATTPLAPEARDAMLSWLFDRFGNPHSPHRPGREAKAAVEVARAQVATLLPPGGRIAFTSGATEALNWAIKGTGGGVVTIATEHAAVLDTVAAEARSGRAVTILDVGRDGLVDSDQAAAVIAEGIGLVAAMLVNNEIGAIQPVAALAAMARTAGALFLCDAVQGFGRVAIPDGCDLIAISAHKIHGPKGIGALWIRDGVTIDPLLHGGGQGAIGYAVTDAVRRLRRGSGGRTGAAGRRYAARRRAVWPRPCDAGRLDDQRVHGPSLSRQSQHSPRRAGRGTADVGTTRCRFLGRIGVRQRIGPDEPRAARARPERCRSTIQHPAGVRALHDRGRHRFGPRADHRGG
jgi:cysteine desulfurase